MFILHACRTAELQPDDLKGQTLVEIKVPAHFPPVPFPENNIPTEERIKLGKMLFNDKRLSRDLNLSCESCHHQELAFSDPIKVLPGSSLTKGVRNASTLANVAYHPYFFREGGNPTLEFQVFGPVDDSEEFNFSFPEIIERLKEDELYKELSNKTYQRDLDAFVITRAIASYERTLISGNSRFDAFYYHGDESALNENEKRGLELFFSDRLNCTSCHSGFDFTTYEILNNGLYETYEDLGLMRITSDSSDIGKFKIPTLRNIEVTAPYMFDGSLPDLESVIEHYNGGGKGHPNQSELIQALNLSQQEKEDLIAFLKSLTDREFLGQ